MSAKDWVAWANSDNARDIVSAYFSSQVRQFKKDQAKSMEAFLAGYNIL